MNYSKKVISKRNSSKKNPRKKNRRNTKINKKIVSKKKFFGGSAVSKQYTASDIFDSHLWAEDSMRQLLPYPDFHTNHHDFILYSTTILNKGIGQWYFNIHIENLLNKPDNYSPVKITEQHLVYFSNFLYLPRIRSFLSNPDLFSELFNNDTFKNIINFITFTKLLELYFRGLVYPQAHFSAQNTTATVSTDSRNSLPEGKYTQIGYVRDIVQGNMMVMLDNLKKTDNHNDIPKETDDMLKRIQEYIETLKIEEIGLISSLNNELAKNTIFDNTIIEFYKEQMGMMGIPIENTNYITREEKDKREREEKLKAEEVVKAKSEEQLRAFLAKQAEETVNRTPIDKEAEEKQRIMQLKTQIQEEMQENDNTLVFKRDFKTRRVGLMLGGVIKPLNKENLDILCELQPNIKIKSPLVSASTLLETVAVRFDEYDYTTIIKDANYIIFKIFKKLNN